MVNLLAEHITKYVTDKREEVVIIGFLQSSPLPDGGPRDDEVTVIAINRDGDIICGGPEAFQVSPIARKTLFRDIASTGIKY